MCDQCDHKEMGMKSFFSGLAVFCTAPAFAAPADSTIVAASALPDATGLVVRMVLSLGIVLMLIWGAVYVLQRLSGKNGQLGGSNASHIRVLDRTYLAPKKAVYVLQIGSRTLAVGVTDTQISPLAELDPEETRAAYPALPVRNGPPSFANLLKDMRAKFSGGVPS